MSGISEKNLRLMATVNDAEYRVIDRPQGGKRMDADFGTFLGRMVRNLKINFGEDRIKKQEAYIAAKETVRTSLHQIYGEEIGEKAFRSGVGHYENGRWGTSANHPLTGRNIAKMLKAADEELHRYPELTGLINDVLDDGAEDRHVVIGDKVSNPMGRLTVGAACHSLMEDLQADAGIQREMGQDHGFWILPMPLKGRVDGSDVAHVGIHMDLNKPDMVTLVDVDGERIGVETNRLGDALEDICRQRLRGEVRSMALFRADTVVKGDLLDEENESVEDPDLVEENVPTEVQTSYQNWLHDENDSLDDLYTDDDHVVHNDHDPIIIHDDGNNRNVEQSHKPPEDLDRLNTISNSNILPHFEPLQLDLRQGSVDVRDRVRNWDHAVERRRETIALDHVGNNGSDEFNRRMLAVNLTLRSGDGAPQSLKHMRQVMFGVTGPDGAMRPLQGQTAPQLTRFLSDSLLQEAHRGLFPDRDPNEIPDLSEVEMEIKSHWSDNRVPVFDITFRAKLPEGSVVTHDRSPPGKA